MLGVRESEGLENGEDWGSGSPFSIPPPPSHILHQIVRVKFVRVKLSASNCHVPNPE